MPRFFNPVLGVGNSDETFCLVFDIDGLHYRHVAAKTKENLLTSFVPNHQDCRHDIMYNFTSNRPAFKIL